MKKIIALQIGFFLICSGICGYLVVSEGVYDKVQGSIVNVLCLSCMKLTTATDLNFTFETTNGQEFPSFIIENLSQGVIFLAFRQDVCTACDTMEPFVQEIFEVYFEKEDTLLTTVQFNEVNVTLIHINLDHSPQHLLDLYGIYDQQDLGAVPMFTAITYGYNRGIIHPMYATGYGTLKGETSKEQLFALQEMIDEAVLLYKQNHHGGHE